MEARLLLSLFSLLLPSLVMVLGSADTVGYPDYSASVKLAHNRPAKLVASLHSDRYNTPRKLIQLQGSTCPEVAGYIAFANMDADGDLNDNCQPADPASLAQTCNELPWCASFSTDGCLKFRQFAQKTSDNCLYVKNKTTTPCPAVAGYTVQQGVDHTGDDIPGTSTFRNVSVDSLAQECDQNPSCVAFNSFGVLKSVSLLNDNDVSQDICFYTKQGDSQDGHMCGEHPGFRTFAGGTVYGYDSFCNSQLTRDQVAAKCLATPGCTGFDDKSCLKQGFYVNNRTTPTCYWERTSYGPDYCPQVPGYTPIQGADSFGNDVKGTCFSNKTMEENAAACSTTASCVAFNMIGCLKSGPSRIIDSNFLGPHHCLYVANSIVLQSAGLGTTTTQQNKKSSVSAGAVAGIIIAVLAVVVAAAMFAVYAWRRSQRRPPPPPAAVVSHAKEGDNTSLLKSGYPIMNDIPGLAPGEVFTRSTAFEYTWISSAPPEAVPLQSDDIECRGKPVIELTKQEVKSQLQLVKNGLMGRGATAFVFTCVWPSRFGKHRLLAVKVLRDGYDPDVRTLESFTYEANVLASLNPPHRNVVRLFGYCLAPPVVCLVLELLPSSLRSIIYKEPISAGVSTSSFLGSMKSRSTSTTAAAKPGDHVESDGTMYLAVKGTSTSPFSSSQSVGFSSTNTGSASVSIQMQPQTLGSVLGTSQLSMLQVLQISIDIAAGLKYLHDMPLVVAAGQGQTGAATNASTSLGPVIEAGSFDIEAGGNRHQQQPAVLKSTKVVHRDLKPANILIGVDGTAKITDFGLARQQMKTTMVTDHMGAGTLPYMAPELLVSARVGHAGAVAATNRVDIYAMAMIMWEMLAGRMPWGHITEPALVAAVMSGQRPELGLSDTNANNTAVSQPLSQIPASLNALPEFNAIIRACWNHREHRRPTAAALHDMLVALRDKYPA